MVVTIAPGKQAHTNHTVKMVMSICSMQIPYSEVVFECWYTTLHKYFCKFYPSIQLTFFPILIQKRFVHSVTKFSVISSVQYNLSFITSFFEEMFSQSRIFMRIIWYYGIIRSGQKWSGKCMVHGLIDTFPRTKIKTLPLRKKSLLLFRASFVEICILLVRSFPYCIRNDT